MKKILLPLLALTVLSACSGEVEDTGPGQPVAHRRDAFKAILKVFEPMGVMLRTDRFEPERFAQLAQALKERRDAPWPYFRPDTNYPPTKALPAVWDEPERFEADRQAFFEATDHLAKIAGTDDKAIAGEAYKAVEETCYSCHDTFKTR